MNTSRIARYGVTIACCLALILSSTAAFAAASTETDGTNHFTLYYPEMTTPINLDGVVTQEVMANSGIVWDQVEIGTGGDVTQQVNLKIAGGDLPDAITMTSTNVLWGRLINENRLIPLDEYFNDPVNYPNLAKIDSRVVDYWRASDGHIYFVPVQYEPVLSEPAAWAGNAMGLWVRDDTLKLAGMTYDDIRTLAGFERYLSKIAGMTDSQGRNIIPLCIGDQDFSGLNVVMSMFGVVGGNQGGWNEQPDGTVVQDYQTDGFKRAWQWLNRMYRAGILDRETATQRTDLYNEKRDSLRYAAYLFNPWNYPNVAVLQQNGISLGVTYAGLSEQGFPEEWYFPTYLPHEPGVNLGQIASFNPFGFNGTGITTSCENPDVLMQALDWMQTPEAFRLMEWGPESLGNYTLNDGIAEQHDEVFRSDEFWGGSAPMKNVTEKGFWWWKNVASVAPTHIPFLEPPWPAINAMLYQAEQLVREQGIFGLVSKADRIRPPVGGAIERYQPVQNDIRLQYYAQMMMASTDSEFEASYNNFRNEMRVRGHDEETIAEFNELYKSYGTTPAGRVTVDVTGDVPRNVFGDGPVVIGR